MFILRYSNNQHSFPLFSSFPYYQPFHQLPINLFIHFFIDSSMFNYFRFFQFLANTYRSFPLSTQCSFFDILTINTTFPSSQSSLTVNPTIKSLLTFSSIFSSILACPTISDSSYSLPIHTDRLHSQTNVHPSIP